MGVGVVAMTSAAGGGYVAVIKRDVGVEGRAGHVGMFYSGVSVGSIAWSGRNECGAVLGLDDSRGDKGREGERRRQQEQQRRHQDGDTNTSAREEETERDGKDKTETRQTRGTNEAMPGDKSMGDVSTYQIQARGSHKSSSLQTPSLALRVDSCAFECRRAGDPGGVVSVWSGEGRRGAGRAGGVRGLSDSPRREKSKRRARAKRRRGERETSRAR